MVKLSEVLYLAVFFFEVDLYFIRLLKVLGKVKTVRLILELLVVLNDAGCQLLSFHLSEAPILVFEGPIPTGGFVDTERGSHLNLIQVVSTQPCLASSVVH